MQSKRPHPCTQVSPHGTDVPGSPLFSVVYWDVQNVMLEDVERIEVIRGPGGTIWGANAVNAVINIITKSAKGTQGFTSALSGGNVDQGIGEARYASISHSIQVHARK